MVLCTRALLPARAVRLHQSGDFSLLGWSEGMNGVLPARGGQIAAARASIGRAQNELGFSRPVTLSPALPHIHAQSRSRGRALRS